MFGKAASFLHKLTGWDNNQQGPGEDPGLPTVYNASYFYGRITRQEAEEILEVNGRKEGLYLLRESITPMGNFSLTIVHNGSPVHYSIEKKVNGEYSISDGESFSDPLSLIDHYKIKGNGFVTMPKVPCERQPDQEPIAFRGLSVRELHAHMKSAAKRMNANMSRALGPMRESLLMHVLQTLHERMPWFHGEISREEGIHRLEKAGHEDGKFLVRSRSEGQSFAVTLSHEGILRHYLINQHDGESFGIDSGPRFKALIVLIDHYHNKKDGLACRLTAPCPDPSTDLKTWENYQWLTINLTSRPGKTSNAQSAAPSLTGTRTSQSPGINIPLPPGRGNSTSSPSNSPSSLPPRIRAPSANSLLTPPLRPPPPSPGGGASGRAPPVPPHKGGAEGRIPPVWERRKVPEIPQHEEPEEAELFPNAEPLSNEAAEELESTYITIRGDVMKTDLRPEQVTLEGKLGSGQFGEVKKGKCKVGGKSVPVAVKTLKTEDPDGEREILSEAKLMKRLDHQHIVRMIGVCKGDTLMLVLELAEFGPLKKYLEKNLSMRVWHQTELMAQVCDGMAYLEEMDVVHRDLATRNVLMVTDHFAKISDFGLSRMMDNDSEYYMAHGPGRWPLMWYAPECLYYHKFDSSADVWSFGVTLWETMSFGARPYHKKTPTQILAFIENGNRLSIPKNCPNEIYQIMLDCWQWYKEDRPTFKDLKPKLQELCQKYRRSER